MVKARLIVKGNVQGVGYRALVKLFARRLGVKGLVRNLEDGSVEVFVDGSKLAIEELSKRIVLKGRAEDPMSLHVDGLDVYWEGVKGYQPAWRGYVGFEIDYGVEELRSTEREMLESLEWSKLHFTGLSTVFREEIGGVKGALGEVKGELAGFREEFMEEIGGLKGEFKYMRADMKEMHEDLRDGIVGVRSEVKDMHVDVNKGFEEMAKRYDAISAELVRTREELTRAVNGLLKLIEEFIRERHRGDRAEREE